MTANAGAEGAGAVTANDQVNGVPMTAAVPPGVVLAATGIGKCGVTGAEALVGP